MISLKTYENLIKMHVGQENEADENWNWKISKLTNDICDIEWGYLDYLEEDDKCFSLVMNEYREDTMDWLYAMAPDGEVIDCWPVVPFVPKSLQNNTFVTGIESAIALGIEAISNFAHSRY